MSQKIYHGANLVLESPVTAFPEQVQVSGTETVTANASAHTKGAWAQLISSTTAQTDWLLIAPNVSAANGVDTSFLLDIGTGGSGSEVVRIANIAAGYRQGNTSVGRQCAPFLFPLRVPASTRIAARAQSAVGGLSGTVQIATMTGAARSAMPTTLDTIGADTAASRGTNLPTSNTYVQLVASTSQSYQALVVMQAGTGSSFTATETSTFTIATGASTAEVDIYSVDLGTSNQEAFHYSPQTLATVYVGHIPSGTRLSAKQSIGRNFRDVILYGVPYA